MSCSINKWQKAAHFCRDLHDFVPNSNQMQKIQDTWITSMHVKWMRNTEDSARLKEIDTQERHCT